MAAKLLLPKDAQKAPSLRGGPDLAFLPTAHVTLEYQNYAASLVSFSAMLTTRSATTHASAAA